MPVFNVSILFVLYYCCIKTHFVLFNNGNRHLNIEILKILVAIVIL